MLRWYLILMTLFFTVPYALFSQVQEYHITCKPEDFQKIYKDFLKDIYIPITLEHGGKTWNDLRMRIRGDGTRYLPKKSLKVKFDNQPFANGKSVLNFNCEYEDPTFMTQYIATELFKKMGYPCYSTEHAKVFINGEFHGLYLIVENMDDEYLESQKIDTKGNLYKATKRGACLSRFENIKEVWEKKTNANGSWNDLQVLIDKMDKVDDDKFYEFLLENFDYKKIIDIISLHILIGHGSTYYHNYYMYHDMNKSGKWMMLPWDMDKTFYKYGYFLPFSHSSKSTDHDNPLVEKCFLDKKVFADVHKRLGDLSTNIFNSSTLDPIVDSLKNELKDVIAIDNLDDNKDIADWEADVNRLKKYIANRYNVVNSVIKHAPSAFSVHYQNPIAADKAYFSWEPSIDPDGDEVTYEILYGTDKYVRDGAATEIKNIKTTSYTLTDGLEEGKTYYWLVRATDGTNEIQGTDNHHSFVFKKSTKLDCNINTNTTLTTANSPYAIECDVIVEPNVQLKIEKGVTVVFKGNYKLQIKGSMKADGKDNETINFISDPEVPHWGEIYFHYTTKDSELNHVNIENGSLYFQKANANISYLNLVYTDKDPKANIPLIYVDRSIINLNHSIVKSNGIREGYVALNTENCTVSNSKFYDAPDAVEFSHSKNCFITNNLVMSASDDGIDINASDNIKIYDNAVINAKDKGISVGSDNKIQVTNLDIKRNIIKGCAYGFAVKSSTVDLSNNNFIGNKKAIYSYRKLESEVIGGTAKVKNNIFFNNDLDFEADQHSKVEISYSLTNKANLSGTSNIIGDPMFVDMASDDYHIRTNSPCIDAGDPSSPKDSDGSRADIGAFFFKKSSEPVVINEINYNSHDSFDVGDWVEFYNTSNHDIDISNWVFKDSDDAHEFKFKANTILKAKAYIVITESSDKFKTKFPVVKNHVGDMEFGLSGKGELIRLFDKNSNLVDSVRYDDAKPWPIKADGEGNTLELKNSSLDNALASSWGESDGHGTPGKPNSSSSVEAPIAKQGLHMFPNPVQNNINLEFNIEKYGQVKIDIIDYHGRKIVTLCDRFMAPNHHEIDKDISNVPAGMYIIRCISNGQILFSKTFIKI